MPDSDPVVRELILDRIDRLEATLLQRQEKTDKNLGDFQKETDARLKALELKVNWALGFATAIGMALSFFGKKIYDLLFGG